MPFITATTDSPSRISVNSPNRSGRCAGCGGRCTVRSTVSHGVPRSISERDHPERKARRSPVQRADSSQSAAAMP